MGAAKQLSLIPKRREEIEFGGELLKGKRKAKRPLSTKEPMHLILKSSNARGKYALNPSNGKMSALIYRMAFRFNVKIYSVAINWSHAHFIIRVKDRKSYNGFVRALCGAMVLLLKAPKGFFDLKPYTKIGTWGRQLKNWTNYAIKNQMQAAGLLSKETKDGLDNVKLPWNRCVLKSRDEKVHLQAGS